MRVLVLHQHYWPEIAATAQILTDLCEDLATAGHDVQVVCGQPSYRSSGTKLAVHEVRHQVSIERVWSYAPSKRTIPGRLGHYASYFGTSLGAALGTRRPDVCLVMSTPPLLLGLSGALLRALRGVPFVYSVQDLYPDIAIHLGVLERGSAASRTIEVVARECYRRAAALVTLSGGMGRQLIAKGLDPKRVHVIPNWADTRSVRPVPRDNPFAREHGLVDRFIVQYSGNLGRSQGLEHSVEAARLLTDLPVTFVFVGDGDARAGLEQSARAHRLDNVRFLPPQPRSALSELLGSCDVALVPMRSAVSHDLVPSKLYGIMSAARPVVAAVAADSEVASAVRTHDCGYVIEPDNGAALAAGIRRAFAAGPDTLMRLGNNGRAACVEHYSRSVLTRRYEEVLLHAAGTPHEKSGTRRDLHGDELAAPSPSWSAP